MKTKRWIRYAVYVQLLGTFLLVVGSFTNVAVYLLGLVFLFPGSVVAYVASSQFSDLHNAVTVTWLGVRSVPVADLAFLPIALLFNVVCLVIATCLARRRGAEIG